MRIKKYVFNVILIAFIISFLCGCGFEAYETPELLRETYDTVQVEILDKYSSDGYQSNRRYRYPVYKIYVGCEDTEYYVPGAETYEEYENRIGETVDAVLYTQVYSDDTVKKDIVALGTVEEYEAQKVISESYTVVQAEITEVEYGRTYVEYSDEEYFVRSNDIAEEAADRIGETVDVLLKTTEYQAGNKDYDVTNIYFDCTSVDYKTVDVVVGDAYTSDATSDDDGDYKLFVKYNGSKYSVSGKQIYEDYKEMSGKKASAVLETRKYADGTVYEDIVAMGEAENYDDQ